MNGCQQVTRKSSGDEPFLDENNTLIESSAVHSRLYSSVNVDEEIANVSGCGDCLAAGIITGILKGWKESSCILLGLHAAKQSLISYETVPQTLRSLPDDEDYYSRNKRENKVGMHTHESQKIEIACE